MKKALNKTYLFFDRHLTIIITILILLVIFVFVRYKVLRTKQDGIITIAKVLDFKGAESGSDLRIEIYFKDKTYITTIGRGCRSDCIGKYYFVKVIENDPTDYPILYGDKMVPDCIIKNVKYFKGWTYFPNYKEY